MKPQCVIFDFDGTLADSREGIYSAFEYACRQTDLTPPGREDFTKTIGPPVRSLFERHFKDESEDKREAFVAHFRKQYDGLDFKKCELYSGVRAGLKSLKDNDLQLAIVTNKPTQPTQDLLCMHKLEGVFSQVSGIDAACPEEQPFLNKSKTLEWTLKKMGVISEDAVFVGDTPDDMMAAGRNNVLFIPVTYGFSEWKDVDQGFLHSSAGDFLSAVNKIMNL